MIRWCVLVVMAALGGQASAGNETEPSASAASQAVYRMGLSGDIVIDTEGNVRDYTLNNQKLTPEIAALVDNSVRKWRFEPILVDGRPVNAKTRLRMLLEAQHQGDIYQVRVSSIAFGAPERDNRNLRPPNYPMVAARAGVEAIVVLVLRLNAEGRVTDSYPESTSLSGTGPERIVQQWRTIFEDNAMAAAKRWRFSITETVDGKPAMDSAVRIPVEYRLMHSRSKEWEAMVPVSGPSRIPAWGRAWETPQSTAALSDGQAQSLTSGFKLKDPIVGNYL